MPVEPNVVDGKFKVLKPRANASAFKEKIWNCPLKNDLPAARVRLMRDFIKATPELWNEDIGV